MSDGPYRAGSFGQQERGWSLRDGIEPGRSPARSENDPVSMKVRNEVEDGRYKFPTLHDGMECSPMVRRLRLPVRQSRKDRHMGFQSCFLILF